MNPVRAAVAARLKQRRAVACAAVLPTRREQPPDANHQNDNVHDDNNGRRQRAERLDAAANARRLVDEINQRRARRQQAPPPDDCVICQHPMLDAGQPLVAMRCLDPPQHVFHEECLMQWRRDTRSEAATMCPVCGADPRVMIKARHHLRNVQIRMDREKRAWCLPRKWCAHLKTAALWGGGLLLAVLTLMFLVSVLWTALEVYWTPTSQSASEVVMVTVMQAPESRDSDLL